jgi:hypothetical protein
MMKLFYFLFALLAAPTARAATLEFKQDAGASTSITWDGNTLEVPQHLKLTALRSLEATLAHDKTALLAAVATQRAELAALEAAFGAKVAAAAARLDSLAAPVSAPAPPQPQCPDNVSYLAHGAATACTTCPKDCGVGRFRYACGGHYAGACLVCDDTTKGALTDFISTGTRNGDPGSCASRPRPAAVPPLPSLEFKAADARDGGASSSAAITWDGVSLEVPQHVRQAQLDALHAQLESADGGGVGGAMAAAEARHHADLAALRVRYDAEMAALMSRLDAAFPITASPTPAPTPAPTPTPPCLADCGVGRFRYGCGPFTQGICAACTRQRKEQFTGTGRNGNAGSCPTICAGRAWRLRGQCVS